MMNDLSKYTKAVKPLLACGRKTRQQLLQQFHASVKAAWDGDGIPSMDFLVESFGPPEEMAAVLMESVPEEEITRCHKRRKFKKAIAVVFLFAFFIFSIYVFFLMQHPIQVVDQIVINPEVTDTATIAGGN